MTSQEQHSDTNDERAFIQIEGPRHVETQWTISVSIGPKHKIFYGQTEEEAQKQTEQYLDLQIVELEKSRAHLRSILGKPKRNPWPDPER